ncbi:hypothetical protein A0H81_04837 [Grifola frondosa]|uniref:Uncharacterized protein n=1 Tax=Grifola frondosa TaxID=5627 RepID=A0A1C7MDX9_GRIFR|nr:hypothetical protein A0H81_04837 [Grifola frondosa]
MYFPSSTVNFKPCESSSVSFWHPRATNLPRSWPFLQARVKRKSYLIASPTGPLFYTQKRKMTAVRYCTSTGARVT